MRDASAELFDQLVYAVCGLIYGEHPANLTIHQRIIGDALRHRGVLQIIEQYLPPIGGESDFKKE